MITRKVFLENWMPVVLTGLLTGVVTGIVVPIMESRSAKELVIYKIKQDARHEITQSFSTYAELYGRWQRIASRSTEGMTTEQINRLSARAIRIENKMEVAIADLSVALGIGEQYFGDGFDEVTQQFRSFVADNAEVRIEDAPVLADLRAWGAKLNERMAEELGDEQIA